MTEQEENPNQQPVDAAILAVMEEVQYVQKDQVSGVAYPVKSERAVISAVRAAMIKNGLILLPVDWSLLSETVHTSKKWDRTANQFVEKAGYAVQASFVYHLVHVPSGTYRRIVLPGSGLHDTDKAAYMASTGSKKYALLNVFLIETGDDPDYTKTEELPERSGPLPETIKQPKEPVTPESQAAWFSLVSDAASYGITAPVLNLSNMDLPSLRVEYDKLVSLIKEVEKTESEMDLPPDVKPPLGPATEGNNA